jgi:predicted amidohydrolase YtcJ
MSVPEKLILTISVFFMISCARNRADTVYVNGSIWTGVESASRAQAIAVKDEFLVAVGSNENVEHLKDSNTKIVDLQGRFVVPGLMDAHTHFMDGGFQLVRLNFREVDSPEDFVYKIDSAAQKLEPGQWILGGNWDHEKWGGELPHHSWVDDVSKEYPVFVHRVDMHMAFANSKAMQLAGITGDTPDPPGGVIDRDHMNGNPTGILREAEAKELVQRVVTPPTEEERKRVLQKAMDYALMCGITQVHDMCSWEDLLTYRKVETAGEFRMRIYAAPWWTNWKKQIDYITEYGTGNRWLQWPALKGMMDGSLGSRTAWMHDPYKDDPSTRGVIVASDTVLFKTMMQEADAAGIRFAIHAIGTRANEWTLDQFRAVAKMNGRRERRFKVEHAQHLRNSEIVRFGREGVIPSVQPFHAIDDSRWAYKRVEEDVLGGTYAFKSLLNSDAKVVFGSDWTVAPMSPILGIYAAVTRETIDGSQPGGWHPNEKMTVDEALLAYTASVAYAGFQEDVLGTIEVGKLADFVVLSRDLFEIEPEEIKNTGVLRTVVGGKTRFLSADSGGKKPIWY